MDAVLFNLAVIGLPITGALALGAYWLKSVFKEVSLSDNPKENRKVTEAEQTANALELQLSVAEDLGGVDPVTLNALRTQVDEAKANAERVRQQQEATAPVPVTVPWLSPVAAIHSAKSKDKPKKDGDGK